ncbi:MAG: sigma-70 family RNA polymerase sigma factor [candidate division Zixibacteria bacterium]|nr:sigma-70 family RNA polymerase sigma factor [candidate division Zixibacteria bacterium]MDH3938152.1 sigma-70 family RNA polymerase sigma factor [candidate division Zixibacteria bacterium]
MDETSPEEKAGSPVNKSEAATSERSLIEAAQNGDQRAYGLLIRSHQKRLFRFVYGLLGSFDATEDIVQEAFVKAYQAIDRFDLNHSFYPWLATIARNTAFNLLEREQKKESLEQLQEKGFEPESTQLGPLENLLNDETQKRFYQAVKALPDKFRAVFVMRHFEDQSYTEIATLLKIPPGTVDSRLYRARKMLVDSLKDLL